MTTLQTRSLLRECIREVLREDYGGDYGGMDMMGPYGMEFVSRDQLYDIFVKPFVNVVGVAAGKTKELSQKGQTLLKVAFEAVATTLIPWLRDDYEEIFATEKQAIDKIRSEYGQYYDAVWDAFKNSDVMIAAFMYRPDLFLTAGLASKAPKVAAKLLSVLSGGVLDNVLGELLKGSDGGSKSSKKSKSSSSRSVGGMGDSWGSTGMGDMGYFESVIREADDEGSEGPLEKLVKNKKVRQLVANSEETQKLAAVGQDVVRGTLKNVFKKAQGVLSAKSLDDLQKKLGKKLPGMEKLSKVPQQERQKAEQQLIMGVKKSMKEFYVKQLESQVKKAVESGVPQNHPFVKDYMNVISKVKNL